MYIRFGSNDPNYYEGKDVDPIYDFYEVGERLNYSDLPFGHHKKFRHVLFYFFTLWWTTTPLPKPEAAFLNDASQVDYFKLTLYPFLQNIHYDHRRDYIIRFRYPRSVRFDEIESIGWAPIMHGKKAKRHGFPHKFYANLYSGKQIIFGVSAFHSHDNNLEIVKRVSELIGKPLAQ